MALDTKPEISLHIYCPEPSRHKRLVYILGCLSVPGGEAFVLHRKKETFLQASGLRACYAQQLEGFPFLPASPFLQEGYLQSFVQSQGEYKGYPVLAWQGGQGLLPYDVFAAAFLLLSRYEEYLDFAANDRGCFPAAASWAYQQELLHLPLVAIWREQFIEALFRAQGQSRVRRQAQVQGLLSYDIDMAFACKHRPLLQQVLMFLRLAAQREGGLLKRHLRTVLGLSTDLYERFDFMQEQDQRAQNKGYQIAYFWLLADMHKPQDICLPWTSPALRKTIRKIAKRASVIGIHPSYRSMEEPWRIALEKQRLEEILQRPITCSRQHYLRFRLPETYRQLIAAGIRSDYSMAYPELPGYRASWAYPFPWYDIEQERETELMLYPLALMDVSLKKYLGLRPEEGLATIAAFYRHLQETGGGLFSQLWHNSSLIDYEGWEGWTQTYEKSLF